MQPGKPGASRPLLPPILSSPPFYKLLVSAVRANDRQKRPKRRSPSRKTLVAPKAVVTVEFTVYDGHDGKESLPSLVKNLKSRNPCEHELDAIMTSAKGISLSRLYFNRSPATSFGFSVVRVHAPASARQLRKISPAVMLAPGVKRA